jgi:SAM-dependent methyltransferase
MSGKRSKEFIVKWYSIFSEPSYFIRKGLYKSVRSLAPQLQGKVLDFGCGSKPYKELFTNAASYTGLDIEVSGHQHKNEEIDVYYDGKIIPFDAQYFDNIFSTEVFEHIFNIDDVLPEINRVLKTGGQLLITCPFVCPLHEKPYDYARYTSFGIKYLLEKHGFRVKEQIKTGNYIEAAAQLKMYYINYMLPQKPRILYMLLYQVFLLPVILITSFFNAVLPARLKRDDLYHSNVVLAEKI